MNKSAVCTFANLRTEVSFAFLLYNILATRMASLQPPPSFLPTPGSPSMPWKQWKGMFENYSLAAGANKFNDDRRRALLLHCLGAEGQRVFHTLPPSSTSGDSTPSATEQCSYSEALARLDNHFTPALNVVAERYRFRQRGQRHDESVEDYISSLRSLSLTCEFGDMRDEFIRDQLVEKTNCGRIRERLLTEPKLTLQSAMTIARQMESASRENRALDASGSADSVNAVKFRSKQQKRPRSTTSKKRQTNPKSTQEQKTVSTNNACYRCGDKRHIKPMMNVVKQRMLVVSLVTKSDIMLVYVSQQG